MKTAFDLASPPAPAAPATPLPPPLSNSTPARKARRTGKIARLPKKLRDLVNDLLADGLPYAQIVQRLQESTDPPLPYEVSEKNISNWHDGGHQDWLAHRDRLDLLAGRLDFALDLAQNCRPDQLQELSLQLAAIRLCEFLSQIAITDPQADPLLYLRLLSALPRVSREALNLQKYRDQTRAAQPDSTIGPLDSTDRAEACRTAFLDHLDNVMGLRSYRNLPLPNPASPGPQGTSPPPPSLATAPVQTVPASDPTPLYPIASHLPEADPEPQPLETEPRQISPTQDISDSLTPLSAPPTDTCGNLRTPGSSRIRLPGGVCPECGEFLPDLLPSGERPNSYCANCGSHLPLPPPPDSESPPTPGRSFETQSHAA